MFDQLGEMLVQNVRQHDPAVANDALALKRKMNDILEEIDVKKMKVLNLKNN